MSELTAVIAGLSQDDRRQLAHGLVLALSGAAGGRRASGETAPVSDVIRETAAPEEPAAAQSGGFQAGDRKQGGSWTRPEDRDVQPPERRVQPELPARQKSSRVSVEYGPDGKRVSLRRDMAAAAGDDRETAAPGGDTAFGDPAGQLRELSEWFRQDSRRYDPGFTRY